MRLLGLAWIVVALAAVTSLTAGAAASAEVADDEMLMMSVMSGGIEEVPEGAGADLQASAFAVLSTRSTPGGFRSIDVPGAAATRAFGINAAGEIVGSYTDATGTYGYLW